MKLLFVGDYAPASRSGSISPALASAILGELRPVLARADLRLINLESVLIEDGVGEKIPKSGPNLRGVPSDLALLTEGGFDVACLANNHFGDFEEAGALATLRLLEEAGIAHIGGGRNAEDAYRAYRYQKGGVSVSLLAVCENEFGCAVAQRAGAAGFDLARLASRIAEEKQVSRYVIVVFHGGNETNPLPAPAAADRYRTILDLGADALIAGHTHCMQGYEMYKGKPIVYSMGNFYFPWGREEHDPWHYGYMTELTVEEEGMHLTLHPYRFSADGDAMTLFTGEERERVLAYIEEISALIADREELTRYFEGWCLGAGVEYAGALRYDRAFEAGGLSFETRMRLAPVRNLFTCESHAYLLRTLLSLEMENRFDEARPLVRIPWFSPIMWRGRNITPCSSAVAIPPTRRRTF